MGDNTGIEWADATWNPIVGCSRVSEGCRYCYAEREAGGRLKHTPRYQGLTRIANDRPQWTGETRLIEKELTQPQRWKRPRRIFVCDMGDLFHESVRPLWLCRVLEGMAAAPQHTYMILTKRADNMLNQLSYLQSRMTMPPNLQLGVSVEDQPTADERISLLLQIPAAVRFVSAEPLLRAVDLVPYIGHTAHLCKCGWHRDEMSIYPQGSDWWCPKCNTMCQNYCAVSGVITGGESGKHARPMHPDWARSIRDQCVAAGTQFFFKQWGKWAPLSGHTTDNLLKKEWVFVMPDGTTTTEAKPGGQLMAKLGKKAAGRHLDGSVWNQLP